MSTSPLVVFTIISKNYLSAARVLMNSVQAHQPNARCVVILVDELQGLLRPAHENFDLILASDLQIRNWHHFAFKYDILELNTAVKPYAFEQLFARYEAETVIYFDPDIRLYSDLGQLLDNLEGGMAVLTPHLTRPIEDKYLPSELDILRAGSYNLGFFALAKRGDWQRLLRWWQEKLYYLGNRDTSQGLFVDQRWMDLAPSLFSEVKIFRDVGHNVAYWNLSERAITVDGEGRYLVNGRPLVFFHFSGFGIDDPEAVSKHQNRHRLSNLSEACQQIYRDYRQAILESGYAETKKLPYAYEGFPDGVPISPALRSCLLQHDVDAGRWPDPFDDPAFRIWATTPGNVPGTDVLSPYALALHALRPDLRAAFPAPLGASASAYAGWFVTQKTPPEFFHPVYVDPVLRALEQESVEQPARSAPPKPVIDDRLRATWRYYRDFPHIHRPMLPPDAFKGPSEVYTGPDNFYGNVRRRLDQWGWLKAARNIVGIRNVMTARYYFSYGMGASLSVAPPEFTAGRKGSYKPGVNIIGYFHHESGVGQIARDLAKSLVAQEFPVSCVDAESPARAVDIAPVGLEHRINIFNVNADQTYVVQSRLGEHAYQDRYNIGYWFWELPQFPERWALALKVYDEIWVASEFVRAALAELTDLPITRVPVPVEAELPEPALTRSQLGLPEDGFLFLFIFNGASVFPRKNPLGLIKAFEMAFSQDERERNVRLVIKVMNLDLESPNGKALSDAVDAVNGILLAHVMDRETVYNLIDVCDAYVSLHRSEGYGLTMAEAMALGKPVIGTAFSGNIDFMDDGNSFLVACDLITLDVDVPPYEAGSTWAEPNLDEAARLMRIVVDQPQEAAARARRARRKMESEFSGPVVGEIIASRLEEILASLRTT